jgi:transcriptional regulator with XRE-family HTH domain
MDYKSVLLTDLEKGFSKSDLEKLIGLPRNNLSGILKGGRNLSKKSKLKIERWEASEKPNPLSVFFQPAEITKQPPPKNSGLKKDENGQLVIPDEIPRLKGESSIEYRLRMMELAENKTNNP